MKELWTTNPFHLVNSPFAEMGYNSSKPNIVPAHLLLATRRPSARHPLASRAASADANRCPHPFVRTSRRHYGRRFAGVGAPYPCAASAGSPRTIRRHEPFSLYPPAHKPSARTNTLSPCKNTFCAIVNCPLQTKPVFYFLFTSKTPRTHRIRVKSSLLRLGRFCLALSFTHLGKDIT